MNSDQALYEHAGVFICGGRRSITNLALTIISWPGAQCSKMSDRPLRSDFGKNFIEKNKSSFKQNILMVAYAAYSSI